MTSTHIALLLLALHIILSVISILHALLYKKDPRAALGWIAVCFAYPIIGPLFYYFFGINRVRTRARQLTGNNHEHTFINPLQLFTSERSDLVGAADNIAATKKIPDDIPESIQTNDLLRSLARATGVITRRPLAIGNIIHTYFTGDSAYQQMITAIQNAQHSVCLSTYIFETNRTGRQFIAALTNAHNRGLDVRVLLDGIGECYSFPRAGYLLKKNNITVARFTPPTLFPLEVHINLRNHRKLLLIDGNQSFTGGMNIGDRHLNQRPNGKPGITDLHFFLGGAIARQLQDAFEEDWAFATGNEVKHSTVSAAENPSHNGNAICRVVTDGPNEDLGKLTTIISSAAALARKRITIMTPYFLPPPIIISALQTAALRGVEVTVILPTDSNQPVVHWATRNMLWELLQYGVRVYYQPPPFNHSKIMLIDDCYAHIGSANLDSRSLRLNFELIVEIFDENLVSTLSAHAEKIRQSSIEETLLGVDQRRLLTRIRDAIAWLFSPYL